MVKRLSLRDLVYTGLVLVILVMSWESSLANAALLSPTIPEESIRIRILANSDGVEDQWIKKQVREAIVASIEGWEESYPDIEQARQAIRRHMPELEMIVDGLLTRYGYAYGYAIELGRVDFPAKMYDGAAYPAGEYEALRITLGEGRGANWWCVLFPPLCFGAGTVKAKAAEPDKAAGVIAKTIGADLPEDDEQAAGAATAGQAAESEEPHAQADHTYTKPEVRFFLVDLFQKIGSVLKGWFA